MSFDDDLKTQYLRRSSYNEEIRTSNHLIKLVLRTEKCFSLHITDIQRYNNIEPRTLTTVFTGVDETAFCVSTLK